jgi:hypothetical protein
MATTFSSNIGSKSLGGFSAYAVTTDDYVSAFFADMVTGNVINSTSGEEQYATTLSAGQLAALSTNLKALLAAAVASGADPTAAPLAYLRKLVGFVALDDGQTLTYSTSTYTVDGVDYEEFYIELTNQPGTVMMYIPNSASAGLFTGSGSDEVSVPPPVIPTTQRTEYVANVPGLYLPGVACLTAPNSTGVAITLTPASNVRGIAGTAPTGSVDFLVEKYDYATNPAPGLGTKLFDIRFNGSVIPTVEDIQPDQIIDASEILRVVNPVGGDATLADVAISIMGTLPLT